MAESSAKKWEEDKQKVESQQARAVGALFELNEGGVDFEAAKNIGLVNDETRGKIEKALGANLGKELFAAALERQKAGGKPPVEAFKRAFATVYGKFDLEQRDVERLEKPGSPLMKVFGKVLKFPIEEIDGVATIKGRPELMAAVSRLQRVLAESDAAKLVEALKPKFEEERAKAEQDAEKAAAKRKDLSAKNEKIGELAGDEKARSKELDGLLKAMKETESEDVKAKKRSAKQAAKEYRLGMKLAGDDTDRLIDVRPILRRFGIGTPDDSDHILDIRARYMAGIFTLDQKFGDLAEIFEKMNLTEGATAIAKLREDMKNLSQQDPMDLAAWKTFLEGQLKSTVEAYASEKFLEHANAAWRRLNSNWDMSNLSLMFKYGLPGKIQELNKAYEFLSGNYDQLKGFHKAGTKLSKTKARGEVRGIEADSKRKEAKDAKGKLIGEMTTFIAGAQAALADGVPTDASEEVNDFAGNFQAVIVNRADTISTDELENFVIVEYKPFVALIVEAITKAAQASVTESDAADGKLQNLTDKLDRINSLSAEEIAAENILQKAFPGVSLEGGKVKIRGFETKFGHVAKQLDGAATFLSEPEKIEALDENYKKLKSLGERLQPDKLKDDLLTILGNDAQDISLDGNVRTQGNVIEATMKALERNNIQDAKGAKDDEKKRNQQARVQQGIKVGRLKDMLDTINEYLKVSSAFHGELKTLVTHLEILDRAKIEMKDDQDKPVPVHKLVKHFNAIDPKKSDFDPGELTELYEGFGGFFGEDTKVSELVKETKKAKKEIEDNTGLTDAACAKKITGALVARDNPEMSVTDNQKISSLLLADDVATIQTKEGYKSLAERGGAELLDTARQAGFADKLIRLKFKVGEKVVEPFEGLKPAEFATWEGIENLFETNRLDYKGGFLALAAFEQFEGSGPKIEQTGKLEQKLKKLLAKELGVADRMDEAGVVQIVNEAFDKQLEAVRPLVSAFFKNVDTNLNMWTSRRVQALDMEFKALKDQRRTDHIPAEIYEQKLAELIEKAEKYGVKDRVSFGRSAMLRLFGESGPGSGWLAQNNPDLDKKLGEAWNHPYAQWMRDRFTDVGKYFGRTLGKMGMRVGGGAVKGGARLGGSLAWHGGVILPVKAAKYAAMAALTPLIAGINLFRKSPWTPFSIRGAVSGDVRGLLGYVSGEGKRVGSGLLGTVQGMALEDTKGFKMEPYKPKVSGDDMSKQAKELWEKAQPEPIKMAAEPWVDLGAYKNKIGELDEIVGKKSKPKAAA